MALLQVKTRQKYLKELGFYKGEVDGIEGKLTKLAYLNLQNKYFARAKDRDGIYGENTEKLLKSAYNCKGSKYFKLEEFKCKCGIKYCTGYPAVIDYHLVKNLDDLREHFGVKCTITSGLRCSKYNSLVGGVINSSHMTGKAVDIYLDKVSNTHEGRKRVVDYFDTLNYSKYAYCNHYMKYVMTNAPVDYVSKTMGNATHLNVK